MQMAIEMLKQRQTETESYLLMLMDFVTKKDLSMNLVTGKHLDFEKQKDFDLQTVTEKQMGFVKMTVKVMAIQILLKEKYLSLEILTRLVKLRQKD